MQPFVRLGPVRLSCGPRCSFRPLSAQRCLEDGRAQELLIIVGTVLAATVGAVDAALGRLAKRDGHLQSSDRQVTFHAIAHRPANNAPGMQIENDSQIVPSFSGPDTADVSGPLLVRLNCTEVPVQQVWRDMVGVQPTVAHCCFEHLSQRDGIFFEPSSDLARRDIR